MQRLIRSRPWNEGEQMLTVGGVTHVVRVIIHLRPAVHRTLCPIHHRPSLSPSQGLLLFGTIDWADVTLPKPVDLWKGTHHDNVTRSVLVHIELGSANRHTNNNNKIIIRQSVFSWAAENIWFDNFLCPMQAHSKIPRLSISTPGWSTKTFTKETSHVMWLGYNSQIKSKKSRLCSVRPSGTEEYLRGRHLLFIAQPSLTL